MMMRVKLSRESDGPRRGRRLLAPHILIAVCSAVAYASACRSPSDGPSSDTSGTGTGTVDYSDDGKPVMTSGKSAVTAPASTDGAFSIVAASGSGAKLALIFNGVTSTGTYSLAAGGMGAGSYELGDSQWLSTVGGGSGSVTFTTLSSKRAIGTFSFVAGPVLGTSASGTKTISAGSLDITYP